MPKSKVMDTSTEPEHVDVDSEEDLVEVKSTDSMNKKDPKNKGVKMESNSTSNESKNKEWRAEETIAGNCEALQALRELIAFPLLYSTHAERLGLKWRRGLLLYGPPGTGKTSLVRAVVKECDAKLTVISPHTIHRAHVGESEKALREAFMEASSHAMSEENRMLGWPLNYLHLWIQLNPHLTHPSLLW
ncbi:unnamed protein product [Amaranthus hypochondriacus]